MKTKVYGVPLRYQQLQDRFYALSNNYDRLVKDYRVLQEQYEDLKETFFFISHHRIKSVMKAPRIDKKELSTPFDLSDLEI